MKRSSPSIGLLLRRNVDRSYRRGIELEGAWQATPSLRLRGNANLNATNFGHLCLGLRHSWLARSHAYLAF
jgi:outer membrane receptor protein involved in Fe transport